MQSVALTMGRLPRRLKATRAGLVVLAVALALGLAAINTGNNPLFFLWGALLGGIVVSGVLSEATLRPLAAKGRLEPGMRVGERGRCVLVLANRSRVVPALAVTWTVTLRDREGLFRQSALYQMRLGQKEEQERQLSVVPRARGALVVAEITASTAYPFGLFVKERSFPLDGLPTMVRPARQAVPALGAQAARRTRGDGGARSSEGEDFFTLRPTRQGDPWRRILWRRLASTGRSLVVEFATEEAASIVLRVDLARQADPSSLASQAVTELRLAEAGSLAENLLQAGLAVGLWTHGTALAAVPGHEQANAILDALARVDVRAELPVRAPPGGDAADLIDLLRGGRL